MEALGSDLSKYAKAFAIHDTCSYPPPMKATYFGTETKRVDYFNVFTILLQVSQI